MKATVTEYLAPNRLAATAGAYLLQIRLPINGAHPAVGQEVEFEANQVVSECEIPKAVEVSKVEEVKETTPAPEKSPRDILLSRSDEDLASTAKEYKVKTKGLNKVQIVDAILAAAGYE